MLSPEQVIYQRLTTVFQGVFDDDSLALRPDLTADEVAEWDSISHIRLMLAVQDSFGVHFSASEIGRLHNVGDLANLLLSKQA